MARKSMKAATEATTTAINRITGNAPETPAPEPKKEYYLFSLKMPIEFKGYLKRATYRESSPEKTVSITEYICSLIQKDMDEHEGGGKA